MAIKNSGTNNFLSKFFDSINVFDCGNKQMTICDKNKLNAIFFRIFLLPADFLQN